MIKTCIIGASGYTGAELAALVEQHSGFELAAIFVSSHSEDAGKSLGDLHPQFFNRLNLTLQPIDENNLAQLAKSFDLIFLATPHQASHDWMPALTSDKAIVMDLSGAFRLKNPQTFAQYYGFEHKAAELLSQAVYGLAEWHQADITQAKLVAVPGCYPTASLTALKPLQEANILDPAFRPIIHAVSGVTGAGRKASLTNSFSEVSLQAYGVLGHRHQPEISDYLGTEVIFTPHLGNFKRGILATITIKVAKQVNASQIAEAYQNAYQNSAIVRLRNTWPKVDDVVGTAYCDLFWKFDPNNGYLVVSSAIDNLLKGAASQAMQCANLRFGFKSECELVTS
ncbi:N-acetyl-gamma-glutamyl-phosphate reductase [Paraglaciecola aestuariivivens]